MLLATDMSPDQPISDDEPIVVLGDDDPLIASVGASSAVVSSIPPILLSRLATFAQGRLQAGEGNALLVALGADQPRLIATYRMGYLPATYHDALSKADRAVMKGQHLGNRLIFPASDATGQIVDLFGVGRNKAGELSCTSIAAEPLGLLAPTLTTAHDELLITDAAAVLFECMRQGFFNTLLLRGVVDARVNARRLVTAGVKRVIIRTRHDDGEIPDALAAAGIDVSGRTVVAVPSVGAELERVQHDAATAATASSPAVPDRLRIVSEDRTAEVVIVEAGPIRYAVERHHIGDDPRRLVVVRAAGQTVQDRLDLDEEAQRRRFAGNAGQRLGISADAIATHLAQLGPLIAGRTQSEQQRQLAQVPEAERSDAEALLLAPNLLARIASDLTALGWIGEERAKSILYLTGISRLLPSPLWSVYRSSAGAAPWQGTALIAALTPPEERVVFHRLTDAAIRQQGSEQLRHRLVVVDQAECLRPEAALALRVLKERGSIGWATLATDAVGEARGPVAVLAAAAADLDPRCRDCFVTVPADERPEQTERILVEQRRQHGAPPLPASAQAVIVARHHAMQRLLVRKPVIIPDADRIIYPAAQVRNRVEQAWFLGLVEAHAVLHQRQRQERDGAIVATEADIHMAIQLADGVLAASTDGLSRGGRQLLGALTGRQLAQFTMADLAGLLPDWTRWTFRAALQDLLDFGYLESPAGGRGKARAFVLTTRSATTPTACIRLRDGTPALSQDDIRRVGGLAEVGGIGSANFTREVVNG